MKSCIIRSLCASLALLSGTACDDKDKGGGPVTPQESAPIAIALALQTVDEGTAVSLDGSASHDADGNIASYLWTQVAGPTVALTGGNSAIATFDAPNVGDKTVFWFNLTVTDTTGLIGVVPAEVVVLDLNAAPAVTVPLNLSGDARLTIDLCPPTTPPTSPSCEVKDLDGTVASWVWTQESGPAASLTGATTLTPTATLPDVDQPVELIFRLSATDNEGKVGYADVAVSVRPVAAALRFRTVPSTALRNTPWISFGVEILNASTPPVRITGGDAAVLTVRLQLKAGGPAGTLVGTLSTSAVAGVATFTNVMFDTVTPDTVIPADAGIILQAFVDAPALTSPDSGRVKITWPTKLPGIVTAPNISVDTIALVASGAAQDVIIGGSFSGTGVNFDLAGEAGTGNTVDSGGGLDAFVARYSGSTGTNGKSGNLLWVRTFAGAGDATVTGLAVNTSGQIFVAVNYVGVTDFARDGAAALQARAHGGTDVAVARLTSLGWTEWLQDIGGTGDDRAAGLALDGSSPANPIITGTFAGEVNFNPDVSGVSPANSTAVGATDAFALKLGAAAGAYDVVGWHYATGMTGDDAATAFTVRRATSSVTYLAGQVAGQAFLVQLGNTGTASAAGVQRFLGGQSAITGVVTDGVGKVYLLGDFDGTVDFNLATTADYPLTSGDTGARRDIFLAAYSALGVFSYATALDGTDDIFARELALRDGNTDSLVITGVFSGTLDFDPTLGIKELTVGSISAFVLSLDLTAQFEWVAAVTDPTVDFATDALAVTALPTRIGFVGGTTNVSGVSHDFDIDPNLVTTVLAPVPANSRAVMVVKMDEKGRAVP
jgi:hypothetical protein